jgi:hydroxymethylbilane synthase
VHEPAAGALRLGTRRSALATTQSQLVAELLRRHAGRDVELVEVVTRGDVSTAPLSVIGGTGVFASALREALLAGEVDLAVHSLKDLPTAPAPGLVVAAVPPREDPRDVLVTGAPGGLAGLPRGARVGTGSPRRAAQLRAVRPDLEVVDVRGNVDTRLGLVTSGAVDAVVLALAGLSRLGRRDAVAEVLEVELLVPAPGQGALAVECRADDAATLAACAGLDHLPSRLEVTAERELLAALEAGCTAPVGALATSADGALALLASVTSADGALSVRRSASTALPTAPAEPAGPAAPGAGPREALRAAAGLGRELAAALLADGAGAITAAPGVTGRTTPDGPPPPAHPSGAPHPQHVSAAEHLPERRHP